MRVIFGVLGLLVVVAIVGVLAKQQLKSATAPLPAVVTPGNPDAGQGSAPAPAATPREQVQQFQKAVEGAVQAPRPMPDEK